MWATVFQLRQLSGGFAAAPLRRAQRGARAVFARSHHVHAAVLLPVLAAAGRQGLLTRLRAAKGRRARALEVDARRCRDDQAPQDLEPGVDQESDCAADAWLRRFVLLAIAVRNLLQLGSLLQPSDARNK